MPRRHRSPANCIDTRESRPVKSLLPLPRRKDRREVAAVQPVELARVRGHLDDVRLAAVVDEEQLTGVLRSVEVDTQRRRTGDRRPRKPTERAGHGDTAAPQDWIPARLDS